MNKNNFYSKCVNILMIILIILLILYIGYREFELSNDNKIINYEKGWSFYEDNNIWSIKPTSSISIYNDSTYDRLINLNFKIEVIKKQNIELFWNDKNIKYITLNDMNKNETINIMLEFKKGKNILKFISDEVPSYINEIEPRKLLFNLKDFNITYSDKSSE